MLIGQNALTIIQYLIIYMFFSTYKTSYYKFYLMGWCGRRVGCISIYLQCKWNFFSRANLKRDDIGFTHFFMYLCVYTFFLLKTVYARFRHCACRIQLIFTTILMWKSELSFLHLLMKKQNPREV